MKFKQSQRTFYSNIYFLIALAYLLFNGLIWAGIRGAKPKGPVPSVAIIAGCKGKHDTLLAALDSWLRVEDMTKVVLVDWDSKPRYVDFLPAYIVDDRRMHIVTVVEQPFYILTWAINLAAQSAGAVEYLLKLDCDSDVTSDFLSAHPTPPNVAYFGNYSAARSENEEHLNGIFFVEAEHFRSIGGFDERIQGYGWDDEDLKGRLLSSRAALQLRNFDLNRVHHICHGDASRTANVPGDNPDAGFETSINRMAAIELPEWTSQQARVQYTFSSVGKADMLARIVPGSNVTSSRQMMTDDKMLEFVKLAAYEMFVEVEGFQWSPVIDQLDLKPYYLARQSSPPKKLLVAHLMHGMGNRLRALASAMVLAEKSGRWLKVISPQDVHFQARLDDIIDLPASGLHDVWYEFDPKEMELFQYLRYDYMDLDQKGADLAVESTSHIYVRSAYRLTNSLITGALENEALQSLKPSPTVQELVQGVALPSDGRPLVAVHIRNLPPRQELTNLPENEYAGDGWTEIETARNKTDVALFKQEMQRVLQNDSSTIFYVAADNMEHATLLRTTFGDAVFTLPHGACVNRDASCLQRAFADLVLLGHGSSLLGSYWSSFSEIAGEFAGVVPRYASIDF